MTTLTSTPYRRRIAFLLHQNLSPRNFQLVASILRSVRAGWWNLSSYFPRLIASRFTKQTPQVVDFGEPHRPSQLAKKLQSVNLLAPTKICRVMTKYGSDKSRPNNYTPVYAALLDERRGQPVRIFELGLGTNNPELLSNMGVFGAPGASLRGWRQLFPGALIYGADIDRNILFEEDRIKTFYCNQLDRSSISELWSHPALQGGVDIMIEDGLHTFEGNISFLESSLNHLHPGGIYVTEDIGCESLGEWRDRISTIYLKKYPTYEFMLVVLTNHGSNNLLVIRRMAA
jgi:hypothetical protein